MKFSHGELVQMEQAAKNRADNSDRCVFCGGYVPEGRMVCLQCERDELNRKPKPRYIDANKLIESLGDSVEACKKWVRKMKARNDDEMIARSTQAEATLIEAILRTKAMPTADVVEVVRCMDCEWWTKQKDSAQGRCERLGMNPTGGWYCANGKRRKDNDCL